MKFVVLALAFLSTPAFAAPFLMEVMAPRAGVYVLTKNDPSNPCRFMGLVEEGVEARLSVVLPEASTEFVQKGDVVIDLERYYSNIDKWGSFFDRPAFKMINKGTQRTLVQQMVISHQSLYDFGKNRLEHSVTLTSLTGGEQSVQVIQFNDAEKKFVYTYEYSQRNAFGFTTQTYPAGRCEFTLKQ